MDFGKLLFSVSGRIGRKDFWIGFLIVFALNIAVNMLTNVIAGPPAERQANPGMAMGIGLLSLVIALVLTYMSICVYAKRLHDLGRTGWWQAIPYLVMIAGLIWMVASMVGGLMGQVTPGVAPDQALIMQEVMKATPALLLIVLGALISLAMLLWLGIARGQPGSNKYGAAVIVQDDDDDI